MNKGVVQKQRQSQCDRSNGNVGRLCSRAENKHERRHENQGWDQVTQIMHEHDIKEKGHKADNDELVIGQALKTREELKEMYRKEGENINPLVLIQLPDKKSAGPYRSAMQRI